MKMCRTLLLLLCCLGFYSVESSGHKGEEYDVIILGAGLAGVSAARTLVSEGITDFIILEGRSEVGGRFFSQQFGGHTIEMGSQWIHLTMENSENPLFKEAMKYNVTGVKTDYSDLLFYDEDGNNVTTEGLSEFEILGAAFEDVYTYGEKLYNDDYRGDISLRGCLRLFGFNAKTPVQMACEYLDTEYVAAEPSNILSTRFFIADSFGDFGEEDFMVTDPRGSSIIIESILANDVPDWRDKLHLNTVVTAVRNTDGHVTVSTANGTFTGKKVIVTFSIGVLQNSAVQFNPPLPEWKLEALHAFAMADYIHIHLKFSTNITWFVPDNKEWIIYASKRQGYFTVWQNMNKALPESHILQASASGNEARRLQAATDEEVKVEAMGVIRNMFGDDVPDAEEVLVPGIYTDSFFYGSYPNWPLGYTRSQHEALKAPLGDIYFAGDAYDENYYGYSHSALVSGEDTAKQVASCLMDSQSCPDRYVPPYAAKGCTYRLALNYNPDAQIDDGSCMITVRAPNSGSPGINQPHIMISLLVVVSVALI